MNKQPLLLTAVSVLSFFSASQSFASHKEALPTLADPSDTFVKMAAVSNPVQETEVASDLTLPDIAGYNKNHVNIEVEGLIGRISQFNSIVHVANKSNVTGYYTAADPFTLPQKSSLSGAIIFSYTFDNQWDVAVTYRYFNENYAPSSSHTYTNVSQLLSNSTGTYSTGVNLSSVNTYNSDSDITDLGSPLYIGAALGDAAFSVLSGAATLSESSELTYHQANVDAGYRIKLHHGFFLRPFVGLGWRHIGYKDTVTFSTTATAESYFKDSQSVLAGGNVLIGTGASSIADVHTQADITASSGTVTIVGNASSGSGTDTYYVNQNKDAMVSGSTGYVGSNLPDYNSKFNGIGPRFGLGVMYAIDKYMALVAGADFTFAYAKLKTTGRDSSLYTENVQGTAQLIAAATPTDTLESNVNLRVVGDANVSTFSYSNGKLVPEAELNFGFRASNDVSQTQHVTCIAEVGYRIIEDFNALKNVNFKTSTGGTATTAAAAYNAGSSYQSISNYGPYLKLGVTFGT